MLMTALIGKLTNVFYDNESGNLLFLMQKSLKLAIIIESLMRIYLVGFSRTEK